MYLIYDKTTTNVYKRSDLILNALVFPQYLFIMMMFNNISSGKKQCLFIFIYC